MEYTSKERNTYRLFEEGSEWDSEDTISLCDLSFTENVPQEKLHNSPMEEDEDSFCFSANTNPNPSKLSPIDSLLLFGKSIPYKKKSSNLQYTNVNEELEQERSRVSLFRSDSFNRFSSSRHDGVKTERFIADYYGRSSSLRLAKKRESSPAPIGDSRRRDSVSGGFRKYKALIGLAKFPGLNEIRRRQSRLPPAPMFPADSNSNGISGKSLWGLIRPLKSRSHRMRVTSFGCVPRRAFETEEPETL